jgi:Ankyrin repeats (3 copies)
MLNSLPNETHSRARELTEAVESGDAARVEALLAAGARADAPTREGETPLMRAASLGYEDVARALLEAGADADARRGDGFTPLILAVFFGHERIVRLLLTYGADASAHTRLGTTPEHWAAARGFVEIASLLRSAEALGAQAAAHRRRPGAAVAAVAAGVGSVEDIFKNRLPRASEAGTASDSAVASADEPSRDSVGAWESESAGASGGSAQVSVRRGGKVPAHPSSSAFGLSGFMRSWQASVGTALLLLALGVAVYAVWRGGKSPQANPRPAPVSPSPAQQTLAQPPAPSASATQPTPAAVPTPDAQNGLLTPGVNGAAYPATPGQTFYAPPVAPIPGQAGLPAVPAVISESGMPSPSPEDASKSKRRNDAAARDAASNAQPPSSRDDAGRDAAARSDASGRDARPPASDSQPTARQTQQTPAPQPSSTPERGKVIQWPPQ